MQVQVRKAEARRACASHATATALILALTCSALLLVGCGGDTDAYTPPLPEHDPEARLGGRTALEHAAGLADLDHGTQRRALQALAGFGVNGLPARAQVKAFLDTQAHEVIKLEAIDVLIGMQDPEAPAVIKAKLLDSSFARSDEIYLELEDRLGQAVDVERFDPRRMEPAWRHLVARDLPHAERLLQLELAFVSPDFMRAVFEAEHSAGMRLWFLQRLGWLTFLDDAAKLGFINDNKQLALRHFDQTLGQLVAIGSREALDLALSLGDLSDEQRYRTLVRFAGGTIDPEEVVDRLVREALASEDPGKFDVIAAHIESVFSTVRSAENNAERQRLLDGRRDGKLTADEYREQFAAMQATQQERGPAGGPRAVRALEATLTALRTLIDEGPSPDHQALAMARLARFAQGNAAAPVSAMAPLAAALMSRDAPDIVRGTAAHELRDRAATLASRNQDAFYAMAAEVLWANDDPAAAGLIETMWSNAIQWGSIEQRSANVVKAYDAILADVESHLDRWAVNSAVVVIATISHRLAGDEREARERAAAGLGQLFASEQADYAHIRGSIGVLFAGGSTRPRPAIVDLEHNSVAGVMSFFEPVVFAGRETPIHTVMLEGANQDRRIGAVLTGYFDGVRRRVVSPRMHNDAEERARWVAFLQRIAASGDEPFTGHATTALQSYARIN